MALFEQIDTEYKAALKRRDERAISAYRMLKSSVKNA